MRLKRIIAFSLMVAASFSLPLIPNGPLAQLTAFADDGRPKYENRGCHVVDEGNGFRCVPDSPIWKGNDGNCTEDGSLLVCGFVFTDEKNKCIPGGVGPYDSDRSKIERHCKCTNKEPWIQKVSGLCSDIQPEVFHEPDFNLGEAEL